MFLLRETDRSVSEICFDVGFASLGTPDRRHGDPGADRPAVIALTGRWNWWLPNWPARLLRVEPPLPPRVVSDRKDWRHERSCHGRSDGALPHARGVRAGLRAVGAARAALASAAQPVLDLGQVEFPLCE